MLLYFIPGIWMLLLILVIARSRFFRVDGISNTLTHGAFLFKVLLGFANYYIWSNVIGHGDSLRYFHDSLIVYNSIFDNPRHYFEMLTRTSLENVPEYLKSYQNQLFIEWHVKEYHMVRLMAILNVFTFGNAWANIVILTFVGFATSIGLFKVIVKHISAASQHRKILFLLLFFFPSLIFWTGGLLKEAPVFILLSIIVIQILKTTAKPLTFKDLKVNKLIILIALVLLFLIRDYVALLTLFNLLIYTTVIYFKRLNKNPFSTFTLFTISLVTACLIIPVVLPQFNYFEYIKKEQTYFLSGGVDPDYTFKVIGDSGIELIKLIPYAINNILFRPNILHSHEIFRIYQSIELIFVWIAICILLYRIIKNKIKWTPIAILFIVMSIELLFIYGMLVTDADTLSRYRSIPVFFILLFMFISSQKKGNETNPF